LRDADFRGTSLTVAHFAQRNTNIRGAKFRREDIEKEGVGEEDQVFLLDERQGAIIE
jgi:hypothetical protein